MAEPTYEPLVRNRAIHPGRHLADQLEALNLTAEQLAAKADLPVSSVNQVLRGVASIDKQIGLQLEQALGTPAHFWLKLQSSYNDDYERLAADPRVQADIELLDRIPWRKFLKAGWIEERGTDVERVGELHTLYDVDSLSDVQRGQLGVAFRITQNAKTDSWALAAWLQQGEWQAIHSRLWTDLPLADTFDPDLFRLKLSEIRGLTRETRFWPLVRGLCAVAGVQLEFVPHVPKSGANGATRWLEDRHPLIQLSILRTWADMFWFSFFHEAAHVLDGPNEDLIIDLDKVNRDSPAERAADEFAANMLISPVSWRSFTVGHPFSGVSVKRFAREIGVHSGIVVGRLQHEQLISNSSLNNLRQRLDEEDFRLLD